MQAKENDFDIIFTMWNRRALQITAKIPSCKDNKLSANYEICRLSLDTKESLLPSSLQLTTRPYAELVELMRHTHTLVPCMLVSGSFYTPSFGYHDSIW
jgi:hypothetical protein